MDSSPGRRILTTNCRAYLAQIRRMLAIEVRAGIHRSATSWREKETRRGTSYHHQSLRSVPRKWWAFTAVRHAISRSSSREEDRELVGR